MLTVGPMVRVLGPFLGRYRLMTPDGRPFVLPGADPGSSGFPWDTRFVPRRGRGPEVGFQGLLWKFFTSVRWYQHPEGTFCFHGLGMGTRSGCVLLWQLPADGPAVTLSFSLDDPALWDRFARAVPLGQDSDPGYRLASQVYCLLGFWSPLTRYRIVQEATLRRRLGASARVVRSADLASAEVVDGAWAVHDHPDLRTWRDPDHPDWAGLLPGTVTRLTTRLVYLGPESPRAMWYELELTSREGASIRVHWVDVTPGVMDRAVLFRG